MEVFIRKSVAFAFCVALLGAVNNPAAAIVRGCTGKPTGACINRQGQHGSWECDDGGPVCVPSQYNCPVPESGKIRPKYKILSVIYAPPGTKGGGSTNSVTYGSGSTLGSSTSVSHSFKEGWLITATQEIGLLGTGESIGVGFEFNRNYTDQRLLDFKKTASLVITKTGGDLDGIDHDRDEIWLLVNPTVKLTLTPSGGEWTLDSTSESFVDRVFVGGLKDPSDPNKMPPDTAKRLEKYGITQDVYPDILKADQYASGAPPIDAGRFKKLFITFPYAPPYSENEKPTTLAFTLTNDNSTGSSTSVETDTTVTATFSASASWLDLYKASIKAENKWVWTDADTRSKTTGTSESASVVIGGPAFGYRGPTLMEVYYDVLYKTYLFVPYETTADPSLSGTVKRRLTKPVSGKEIIVMANGVKYRTFTNAQGEYRIYDRITGPLQIQVDTLRQQFPQPPHKNIDFLLP